MGALAERLGHDALGAQAVGGGERALALVVAVAVADQERVVAGVVADLEGVAGGDRGLAGEVEGGELVAVAGADKRAEIARGKRARKQRR